MDAIKFVKERNRMCKSFGGSCDGCPADKNTCCNTFEWQEKLVTIVEEWSKENPRKTRQELFLKQYPKVVIYNGVIAIRPCKIEKNYTSQYCLCDLSHCVKCREEYWLEEVD